MSQMASLIGRDAMLATRVLQAANSAVYRSSGGPISTIPDAVRRIGCSAVRGIASALGVFDAMPATSADGFNPIRSWQHSLAVATLCERFTAVTDPDNAGIAYLVGLCHDLGDILFQTQFAAEYRQVLDAEKRTQRRRADLERDMLGMTHGELVVTILRAINLPDGIRTPIEAFHASPAAAARNPLSRVLCVADQLANGMLLASSVDSEIRPLSRAECHAATGNEAPELPDTIAFRTEISVMTSMLARLSAADERKMMEPMFKLRDRTLWLARDSSLSPSDPVALALATMVNIQVHDRLPGAGEAQSLQGLFVLARDATVPGFSAAEVTKSQRLLDASAFVLCLTGAADKTAPLAAEQDHKRYPIKLEELASFVAKACDLVGTRASENRAA
jgi:HD-like signal output (HDOD) protein